MIEKKQLDWHEVRRIISTAISEDIGSGDITTLALFDEYSRSKAAIIAKQEGIIAGLPVAREVFETLGEGVEWDDMFSDGMKIKEGDILAEFTAYTRQILSGERLALNILQRLSGIATITSGFVREVEDLGVKIADTRKTTPGIRSLEKYAVSVGGGYNHRMGLYDAVMIKDNHIKEAGGIKKAVSIIRSHYGSEFKIEVETQSLEQVREAMDSTVDIIMLDNMNTDEMSRAVKMVDKRFMLEASGGITMETVRSVAETGVDLISVGAITHSAEALDISLDMLSL